MALTISRGELHGLIDKAAEQAELDSGQRNKLNRLADTTNAVAYHRFDFHKVGCPAVQAGLVELGSYPWDRRALSFTTLFDRALHDRFGSSAVISGGQVLTVA